MLSDKDVIDKCFIIHMILISGLKNNDIFFYFNFKLKNVI